MIGLHSSGIDISSLETVKPAPYSLRGKESIWYSCRFFECPIYMLTEGFNCPVRKAVRHAILEPPRDSLLLVDQPLYICLCDTQ